MVKDGSHGQNHMQIIRKKDYEFVQMFELLKMMVVMDTKKN